MVVSCYIVGCTKRGGRDGGISFHRIPAVVQDQGLKTKELSLARRQAWICKINRKDWVPTWSSRVCSEHFLSGRTSSLYDTDNLDWVPSQKMGYVVRNSSDQGRYVRVEERRKKRRLDVEGSSISIDDTRSEVDDTDPGVVNTSIACQASTEMVEVTCQTDAVLDNNSRAEEELLSMKCDYERLQTKVATYERVMLTEDSLQHDELKLKFYTGIQEWCVFKALFKLVYYDLPVSPKLSKFSLLAMFLVKLRLNLFDEDIASRFGVHQSTVSRNFHRVLDIMAVKMAHLIKWPDRETLRQTMPMSFRKFFKTCCIIIDCTEIFMERPSDLLARAQVWSNYKHHSTVKFLIGITPQGTISFLSECVGGRMSDKQIVEESQLIDYLLPGDVILADRGFTCGDYARMAMAEVKTPPFTKGKKQLEKVDVDWSRELSIVRIHVERVIGQLKQKYTILQSIIPIALICDGTDANTTIDKVVRVCCALVNLCPSVVPQD